MRCGCILHASRGTPDGTTISWIICGPLLSHWRATERSGVCTAPLFENTGLVIRPNLHRDSEGEVGGGAELFWWFHSIESLKYIPLMKISKIGGGAEFARNWIYKERGWVEIARKGISKEWTLQGMRAMLSLSQFRRRQYLACYTCICHVGVWVVLVSGCF